YKMSANTETISLDSYSLSLHDALPIYRERGADDDGVVEVLSRSQGLVEAVADGRTGHLGTAFDGDVLELLAVLTALDGLDVGADEFDAVLLEHTGLVEGDRRVQR